MTGRAKYLAIIKHISFGRSEGNTEVVFFATEEALKDWVGSRSNLSNVTFFQGGEINVTREIKIEPAMPELTINTNQYI